MRDWINLIAVSSFGNSSRWVYPLKPDESCFFPRRRLSTGLALLRLADDDVRYLKEIVRDVETDGLSSDQVDGQKAVGRLYR